LRVRLVQCGGFPPGKRLTLLVPTGTGGRLSTTWAPLRGLAQLHDPIYSALVVKTLNLTVEYAFNLKLISNT